ncbi:MAG TPA: aldo/keto reductase, partial [Vicinamibacteria bacterium]|nr:aldo/keto reductase [Vicinamibacteria bacterium]
EELRMNVAIARSLVPMSAAEQAELVGRSARTASAGRCELFKSTSEFDGPHHRRQHGAAA